MPLDMVWFSNMGLPEILLWLLTFAIVYGFLDKIKFIANKEINAIIAMVTGFLVLLGSPMSLIAVLSNMSQSLILIVLGIMVLLVFVEVAGLKHTEYDIDEKTGKPKNAREVTFFSENKQVLGMGFLLVGILVFIGSGGLKLLGWNINLNGTMSTTMMFFIVIILAILWMIGAIGGKKHKE